MRSKTTGRSTYLIAKLDVGARRTGAIRDHSSGSLVAAQGGRSRGRTCGREEFHAGRKSPTRAIHPPRTATLDGKEMRVRIFTHREALDGNLAKIGKLNGELLEIEILMFCQILEDGNPYRELLEML